MSRYITDNFNGVLFLLREPNSNGKKVTRNDNDWISKVLDFKKTKNADKYRKTFISLLKSIGYSDKNLHDCAFDNINPTGGKSSIGDEYRHFSVHDKANRALSIIDEISPKYVFTCLDIYNAIKQYLIDSQTNYIESIDGIVYKRGKKNKIEFIYNNNKIQLFNIYHPCLGWNILNDCKWF